jgi:hypothetical protein
VGSHKRPQFLHPTSSKSVIDAFSGSGKGVIRDLKSSLLPAKPKEAAENGLQPTDVPETSDRNVSQAPDQATGPALNSKKRQWVAAYDTKRNIREEWFEEERLWLDTDEDGILFCHCCPIPLLKTYSLKPKLVHVHVQELSNERGLSTLA